MSKITPCLWFDDQAEEAAQFYLKALKGATITHTTYYTEAGKEHHQRPPGSVLTVMIRWHDQEFMLLNGGPQFKFSEAISLMINCKDQAEIDEVWEGLTSDGGEEVECGWLKDKFGVSWQVVPENWGDMYAKATPEQYERMMSAMFTMVKFDIAKFERALNEPAPTK